MYDRAYQKNILREKTVVTPNPKRRFRRVLWGAMIVIVVSSILVFFRSAGIQVREMTIAGAIVTDPMEMENFLKEKMQGKYLWLIPKTNIVFLGVEKLEDALARRFTRLSSVEIDRTSLHRIAISVTEYEGKYLWCKLGTENCYFMDPSGMVFASAPFFSGSAYTRLFGGTESETLPFRPFPPETLELVRSYSAGLPEVRIIPTSFDFESPYKLVIGFSYGNRSSMLIVNPEHPPEAILENLDLAFNVDPLRTQFRKETKHLLYLDARSSNLNEIFYKFE